jgi:hypothetical protein
VIPLPWIWEVVGGVNWQVLSICPAWWRRRLSRLALSRPGARPGRVLQATEEDETQQSTGGEIHRPSPRASAAQRSAAKGSRLEQALRWSLQPGHWYGTSLVRQLRGHQNVGSQLHGLRSTQLLAAARWTVDRGPWTVDPSCMSCFPPLAGHVPSHPDIDHRCQAKQRGFYGRRQPMPGLLAAHLRIVAQSSANASKLDEEGREPWRRGIGVEPVQWEWGGQHRV